MISEETMRLNLLVHIKKKHKTQKSAAAAWGLTPSAVSNMITGLCRINKTVLDEMGYQKVELVSYQKK